MKSRIVLLAVLSMAYLPLSALAQAIVEERYELAAGGTVSAAVVVGEIRIEAWDRDEVQLKAHLGKNQELDVSYSDKGLRIEVQRIDDGKKDWDEAVLELSVPVDASIIAEGVSADVTIKGSRGDSVTAESVSGDIEVWAETGRVELSSVSGDIRFEGTSQRTTLETVSGEIDCSGVSGELAISSVSGDAILSAGLIDRGQFETVSGAMKLGLEVSSGGRLTVQSMNGDIILSLPEDQQGEFGAQTFSGDIDSEWGEVKSESFGPGSHLKYVAGASGTVIQAETFSGDVTFKRR